MKLVLDTNVLFAAYIASGTCARLYEQVLATETLVLSAEILTELEEKLIQKARLPPIEAAAVCREVASAAVEVRIEPLPTQVCRDATDDVILATALVAKANAIVTGDQDLLVLGSYQNVPIITPAECLIRLQSSDSQA